MGNYKDLESEFIKRTLALISQYESILNKYEFKEQYNYTLLINCLLGLIVMPKEKIFESLPNDRITTELKNQMGLADSEIKFDHFRDLIIAMRHSIAHFDIDFISHSHDFLIDQIAFRDQTNEKRIIAQFKASELLPFLRYYSTWVESNLRHRPDR